MASHRLTLASAEHPHARKGHTRARGTSERSKQKESNSAMPPPRGHACTTHSARYRRCTLHPSPHAPRDNSASLAAPLSSPRSNASQVKDTQDSSYSTHRDRHTLENMNVFAQHHRQKSKIGPLTDLPFGSSLGSCCRPSGRGRRAERCEPLPWMSWRRSMEGAAATLLLRYRACGESEASAL